MSPFWPDTFLLHLTVFTWSGTLSKTVHPTDVIDVPSELKANISGGKRFDCVVKRVRVTCWRSENFGSFSRKTLGESWVSDRKSDSNHLLRNVYRALSGEEDNGVIPLTVNDKTWSTAQQITGLLPLEGAMVLWVVLSLNTFILNEQTSLILHHMTFLFDNQVQWLMDRNHITKPHLWSSCRTYTKKSALLYFDFTDNNSCFLGITESMNCSYHFTRMKSLTVLSPPGYSEHLCHQTISGQLVRACVLSFSPDGPVLLLYNNMQEWVNCSL